MEHERLRAQAPVNESQAVPGFREFSCSLDLGWFG